MELRVERQRSAGGELLFSELIVDSAGLRYNWNSIDVGDLNILWSICYFLTWFKIGKFYITIRLNYPA